MNGLIVYGLAAVAVLAAGFGGGWYFGSLAWESKYEALSAEGWQAKAQAATVAKEAVQDQLDTLNATLANNAKVIHELDSNRVSAESQRDNARRLLAAAKAASAPRCDSLPEAGSGSTAAGAGSAQGPGRPGEVPAGGELGGLLERALSATGLECHDNADQLDGLSAQIKPQL